MSNKQLSFLITFFSMSIVVLLLYNIHLSGQQEDEYIIEMSLNDEDIEELLKEEEKRLEELREQIDPIKSHTALNETAKPSVGEPEPLKTLDELLEEKALEGGETSDEEADFDGFQSNLQKLREQREKKKEELGEKEEDKKEYTDNLKDKRTSISYSLVDRRHRYLPPPIYTCIEGGKVVINIKVGADGYVQDASFNEKSSNTSNGCLVDNAITYALKARFNSSSRDTQKGTITYLFQGK